MWDIDMYINTENSLELFCASCSLYFLTQLWWLVFISLSGKSTRFTVDLVTIALVQRVWERLNMLASTGRQHSEFCRSTTEAGLSNVFFPIAALWGNVVTWLGKGELFGRLGIWTRNNLKSYFRNMDRIVTTSKSKKSEVLTGTIFTSEYWEVELGRQQKQLRCFPFKLWPRVYFSSCWWQNPALMFRL